MASKDTGILTFRLTDRTGRQALHLDTAKGSFFDLEMRATDEQVNLAAFPPGTAPSADHYHAKLSFDVPLAWGSTAPVVHSPAGWTVAVAHEQWKQVLYLLTTADTTISAQEPVKIRIGYRELVCPPGVWLLNATCLAPSRQGVTASSQRLHIDVVQGGEAAPLAVDFVGRRTVLNDGSRNDNPAPVLRLTNLLTDGPVVFGRGSEIWIRFDVAPQNGPKADEAWALGTADQVGKIQIVPPPGWIQQSCEGLIWKFQPTAKTELAAGRALDFHIRDIITNLAPGFTNVYVDLHRLHNYKDGTFYAQLEKSPLRYNGDSGTGMRLRGTVGDHVALHIQAQTSKPALLVEQSGTGPAAQLMGRVGINHAAPQRTLHVGGDGQIDGRLDVQAGAAVGGDCEIRGPHLTVGGVEIASIDAQDPGWVGGYLVPKGGIILWSGAADRLPRGWALCDGQNGTPDLRDRFVVGAGSAYPVGGNGGQDTVWLGIENMPPHSHGIHDPGHRHSISNMRVTNLISDDGGTYPYCTGNQTQHTDVSRTGIAVLPEGGGRPFDNRPPYYALCYIMKL